MNSIAKNPSMDNVRRMLEHPPATSAQDRFAIVWSDKKRDTLHRTARRELAAAVPIDVPLATALLRCAEGDFNQAENQVTEILRDNLHLCTRDNELFISLLYALFCVQRLDLAAAMLKDRYGFARSFRLSVEPNASGVGQVGWAISPPQDGGEHCFTFDAGVYSVDETRTEILAFQWEFPLFAHYSGLATQEPGKVVINRQDIGIVPGLAYCDSRPQYYLIPDCIFISSQGYSYARRVFQKDEIRWADRKPTALWRGATTGIPERVNDWTSLPRAKLCQLARDCDDTRLFDVGFSSVVQFDKKDVAAEIRAAGLMREFISWQEWKKYKYHLVIDGNSSPWSNLFQQLLTGSTVLKVESTRGLVQWYYDELRPWHNFVPIAPDISDLVDKVKWLNRNDRVAEAIGRRGFDLAKRLSYAREIARSVPTISAAIRDFTGLPGASGPYGRALS